MIRRINLTRVSSSLVSCRLKNARKLNLSPRMSASEFRVLVAATVHYRHLSQFKFMLNALHPKKITSPWAPGW